MRHLFPPSQFLFGVLLGFLWFPFWSLLALVARAIVKPSSTVRLSPAPLDSQTLERARRATSAAGFGGGLGPTAPVWDVGQTTPLTWDGRGPKWRPWGESSTLSPAATPALTIPTRGVQDYYSSIPATGKDDLTPITSDSIYVMDYASGEVGVGDSGALTNIVWPDAWNDVKVESCPTCGAVMDIHYGETDPDARKDDLHE